MSTPSQSPVPPPASIENANPPPPPFVPQQSTLSAFPQVDPRYFKLPTRRWIDLSIFYDVPTIDPVMDVMGKAMPTEASRYQRRILKMEDVDVATEGGTMWLAFGKLIAANSWRGVALLARKKLIACHPGQVDEIMWLWFFRFIALSKLNLLELAQLEIDKLGEFDSPELRFEMYPDLFPSGEDGKPRQGWMVSFELRVFHAKLPGLRGNVMESINRLYKLMFEYRVELSNNDISAQEALSLHSRLGVLQTLVVNHLLELRDTSLALEVTGALLKGTGRNPDALSAQGRTFLQLGDIPAARAAFAEVQKLVDSPDFKPGGAPPNRPDLVLMNLGFLHMAEGEFEQAVSVLTELLTMDPQNAVAVNNLAVCQLYMGNVGQAISFLESIAIDMPTKAGICHPLLFNLSTLFDLTDQSKERKKRLLLNVVVKHAGDNFSADSLKL
ncbi:hypothetical protein BJ742DRAFT_736529 [Cladochytrium replicatum]|nr:hypothetical protein BJ742DRAFT_736529 [Cladochytrium replicatum]